MKAQGSELKNHFRTTIVPTSQRLKETHAILEVQVDPVFAAGLLAFDEMGKKMETALLHEADDAEKVLSKAQVSQPCNFGQCSSQFCSRKISKSCSAGLNKQKLIELNCGPISNRLFLITVGLTLCSTFEPLINS